MKSERQTRKNSNTTLADNKPACTVCLDKKRTRQAGFNALITEAVDSAFSLLLGDTNQQALYHKLSSCFGIPRKNIPKNIEGFSSALQQIFGQSAYLLEACMIQTLHNKTPSLKIFPAQGELTFKVYVESLSSFFSSSGLAKSF